MWLEQRYWCQRNVSSMTTGSRSQWSRGVRRGSAAVRFLRLRVRITSVSVSCEYMLSDRDLCVGLSGWSLVQRNSIECGVPECDREASAMRWPYPTKGCCAIKNTRCKNGPEHQKKYWTPYFFSFKVTLILKPGTFLQNKISLHNICYHQHCIDCCLVTFCLHGSVHIYMC
jgi:hypothetical protein